MKFGKRRAAPRPGPRLSGTGIDPRRIRRRQACQRIRTEAEPEATNDPAVDRPYRKPLPGTDALESGTPYGTRTRVSAVKGRRSFSFSVR
jgi:hypothetical protein